MISFVIYTIRNNAAAYYTTHPQGWTRYLQEAKVYDSVDDALKDARDIISYAVVPVRVDRRITILARSV